VVAVCGVIALPAACPGDRFSGDITRVKRVPFKMFSEEAGLFWRVFFGGVEAGGKSF
jgi:hypothetical protein